jgi:hypothetical protein
MRGSAAELVMSLVTMQLCSYEQVLLSAGQAVIFICGLFYSVVYQIT